MFKKFLGPSGYRDNYSIFLTISKTKKMMAKFLEQLKGANYKKKILFDNVQLLEAKKG